MMAPRARDTQTMDLLAWEPPSPVASFPVNQVRAASLRASIAKAVAATLKECGRGREEVAAEISAYLGEPCSKGMLDAYSAESREEHVINVVRFLALVHATRDYRLLQLLAEPFGLALIDARYLPAIEDAVLDDKITELTQRKTLARKRWKGAGS
jgi:hypothetical protein